MSSVIEVKVPDIGDFKDVPIIEVLVKPGERVAKEASLITLESDKATMEVPAPEAGVVKELKVKVGDKVAEGTLILTLETEGAAAAAPAPRAEAPARAPAPSAAAPVAPVPAAPQSTPVEKGDYHAEVLVLGSGPGGYTAAFRAADLGRKVVLVERYATLGGVCLNVGCIPSKALLHAAKVISEAEEMAHFGVQFSRPQVELDRLRGWKESVVGRLTKGLAGLAKQRKVQVVQGTAKFTGPHMLEVATPDGSRRVSFDHAIIAAGSQSARIPGFPYDDPRLIDSTGALELRDIPKRMLVIGGGIIGLEMATVYSTLGAKVDVVEMLDGLMQGPDRDLVKVWEKKNAGRFEKVMLKTKTVKVEALKEGLKVWFEGTEGKTQAPAEPQLYDMILQSAGRSPNGSKIGADKAGVAVDARGFIAVDRQMRTNVPHIFAIGDLVGQPMLAHKAVHEAHVAAEAAAGHKAYFDARVIPGVAYTDPEVAWVGLTDDAAKKQGVKIGTAKFPWAASGRAIANGRDEGFTKLIFDEETHRIVGGGIVGTHAGDMIGEIALAIEMGADAVDIGKTIHPHPTLGESIGMAAEVYEGTCTDLPPARKK